MHSYQLQPARAGRTWWASVGVTLAVLLVPVALWWPAPAPPNTTSEVVLGAGEWTIPVTVAAEPLHCETNPDSLVVSWFCGETIMLDTLVDRSTADPDKALRRLTAGMNMWPENTTDDILREGPARMLVDAPSHTVGLSLQGTGEWEGEQLFVTISGVGEELAQFTDIVWVAFTGERLPDAVLDLIADLNRGPLLPDSFFPELRVEREVAV
ncbi:MAG TPA: hypothetical protein VFC72_05180 [Corynebacterium sp.]|nr:hypothetical protein [Corynebacterium sp.]